MVYKYDCLIIGSLASSDLLLAENLSHSGLKCLVLRKKVQGQSSTPSFDLKNEEYNYFDPKNVAYFASALEFYALARQCRLIFSLTGGLIGALGKLWRLRNLLKLPPIINICTGSDLTELVAARNRDGEKYRQYLQYTDLNIALPYAFALKNIIEFNLPNIVFLPYPAYYFPKIKNNFAPPSELTIFFHGSHLDWGETDKGSHRNSTKGNDRFIKAFSRAVKSKKINAVCHILDRGSDRKLAKELIKQLGAEDYFKWLPHLSRSELIDQISKASVVVDQFDIGGIGGIAAESMALGKPVIIYINKECQSVGYSRLAPTLNCRTEDEIYEQIMKCSDSKYLTELGLEGQRWINEYHGPEQAIAKILIYYSKLTGHKVVDYGY